jgi:5-methyltetrahydropteroyltriglutamate--homocysteine methyltransferase
MDDWGGVIVSGAVDEKPDALRWTDLYDIAAKAAGKVPVKVSIGAGPANLAWHVYFDKNSHYKSAKDLTFALVPIFNKQMKDLVKRGAKYLQIEDLGAWMPLFTNNKDDYKWVRESIEQMCDGVDAKIGWHFCFGNAWGNDILSASYPEGYQTVLPHFFETKGIDQFVLDYANRDMAGVDFLKNLPKDKDVQIGVLDIRTNAIETPEKIAARIRKVIAAVPADPHTEHGLRNEAAGPHGRQDEAESAGGRREDRAQGTRR